MLVGPGAKSVRWLAGVAAPLLLLMPAWLAVQLAVGFSDRLAEPLESAIVWLGQPVRALPEPLNTMLLGQYGLIPMLPFLLLYALPTLLAFAVLVWLLRDSGVLVRISHRLDPFLYRFGLGSQSLVSVVMGFGCNVPAIIQTRQCGGCERCASASAIAFGAACSYQLPATLAVFVAAGKGYLALPYVVLLALTTLIYLRFALPRPPERASPLIYRSGSLQWPSLKRLNAVLKDALTDFLRIALPVFVLICLAAGLLDWLGAISAAAAFVAPVMGLFNLPGESAVPVMMGAIRKDGIAIGLLAPDSNGLKIDDITGAQLLTLTYLAGVLLPCLVTVATLIREFQFRPAMRMLGRQLLWAAGFAVVIGWTGWVLGIA